jgi:hypothetical protein
MCMQYSGVSKKKPRQPSFSLRVVRVGFVVNEVAPGRAILRFIPANYHSTNAPFASNIRGSYSGPACSPNTDKFCAIPPQE